MMVAVFDMFDQIYLKQPDKSSPEVQNFRAAFILDWYRPDGKYPDHYSCETYSSGS